MTVVMATQSTVFYGDWTMSSFVMHVVDIAENSLIFLPENG